MGRESRPFPTDDSAQYQLDPEDTDWATAHSLESGQPIPAASARESHYDSWHMISLAGEVAEMHARWLADGRPSARYELVDTYEFLPSVASDASKVTCYESRDYLEWVEVETRTLIEEYWNSVEAVSAVLLAKRTLAQAQVRALVA